MTIHLVDVSRYQVERADPLDLAQAYAAGYRVANIALTGGRGYTSGAWAGEYAARARNLGMGVSFYHWLDGRTPGSIQARNSIERMTAIMGGLTGFAHIVDVEETGANGIAPPTSAHVREYVEYVQAALGRHVVIYTGDHWWKPRAWNGAALTPYVHAAPNPGYQDTYPGDASPLWAAGYGGWPDLAVMQWGVRPLPGTGNCSLSAFRDHGVWADISGGDQIMPQADPGNAQPEAWLGPPVSTAVLDDLDDTVRTMARQATSTDNVEQFVARLNQAGTTLRPHPLDLMPRGAAETCSPAISAEMNDWITLGGSSSGCVGDAKHGTGFHRGANYVPATDYSRRRDPNGADGPFTNWNWACAGDFRHDGNATLRKLHKAVLALLRAGAFPMICEMIVQPDASGPVMYWARWEGVGNVREYTGSGHDLWSHLSWIRSKADQRPYVWKEVATVALTKAEMQGVAQETAIKLDADLGNPGSGLHKKLLASEARVAAAVRVAVTGVQAAVLAAVQSADDSSDIAASEGRLRSLIQAAEAAQADRDQAMISALLQSISELRRDATDPITVEELHTALERVYGQAFRQVVTP